MTILSCFTLKRFLLVLLITVILNMYIFYINQPTGHQPRSYSLNILLKHEISNKTQTSESETKETVENVTEEPLTEDPIPTEVLFSYNNLKEEIHFKPLVKKDESWIKSKLDRYLYFMAKRGVQDAEHLCPESGIPEAEVTNFIEQDLEIRGYYKPSHCVARHRLAILVPYIGETKDLEEFLNHIHPFLIQQQVEYQIFVLKQTTNKTTSIGQLFNAGIVETLKFHAAGWGCYIMHSMHLLPKKRPISFKCGDDPRQLFIPNTAHWETYFGRAIAMTFEQLLTVNGFSNDRETEEDLYKDMYARLIHSNYKVERPKDYKGNYLDLENKDKDFEKSKTINTANSAVTKNYLEQSKDNPVRYGTRASSIPTRDGINNSQYKVINYEINKYYTLIKIADTKCEQ